MLRSVGEAAPPISARNQHSETVELTFERPTILYFYPRDDTPGCTTEAEQFNAELESSLEPDSGVELYGVSTDDVESHRAFAEKYGLSFDLLADPNGELADQFGVDTSGGKADRVTFVLSDGEVKAAYSGVNPDGHAREVLSDMVDNGLIQLSS